MAEKIVLVITEVCAESIISSEITAVKCLIYLFIEVHLLLLCRCMDLRKGILFKKIRNHSQPLKLQKHTTIFQKFTYQGNLHMQLEIPSCLGYGPQSLNVYGFDAQTKINAFY